MTWIVPLAGSEDDLAALALSLTDDTCCITRDGDGYIMRSSSFSLDLDGRTVLERAKEIVTALNGMAKLGIRRSEPISVAGVNRLREDGRRDVFVFLEPAVLTLRIVAPVVRVGNMDETIDGSGSANPLKRLLSLSDSNKAVGHVLELLASGPSDWATLYKVWETVKVDAGGINVIVSKKWASRSAIKSFTSTPQHPESVGILHSRHGALSSVPPPKLMTLPKARNLITSIVHKWLRERMA